MITLDPMAKVCSDCRGAGRNDDDNGPCEYCENGFIEEYDHVEDVPIFHGLFGDAGFFGERTGGGCDWWRLQLTPHYFVSVTGSECNMPTLYDDEFYIGFYSCDDDDDEFINGISLTIDQLWRVITLPIKSIFNSLGESEEFIDRLNIELKSKKWNIENA